MGEKLVALLRKPSLRVALGVLVLLVLGGAGYGVWQTQQPPPQPIEFNHSRHTEVGVQCLYCHSGALTGPVAGLPSESKCWACHQQIPITKPGQQQLADYIASGEPIPWVPVAIQPDFVQFNHRPHIAAGESCETCHGDVGSMTVAEPQPDQNMGWCLNCHIERSQGDKEMETRLLDCATCHY